MRLGFSAPAGRLRNADGARRGEKEREYAVEPRDVVQSAIDAYHAHDLDRCLSFYAADVVVKRADGTILMDGAEAVRARYAKSMSDHPNLHYDIPNRIARSLNNRPRKTLGYLKPDEKIAELLALTD